MIEKPEFTHDDIEIIGRENLYQGFFRVEKVVLRHKLFAGGWGETIERELFVRGEAVAVVLYDPVLDTIAMVEQFRVGALEEAHSPWCYEVVAGILEEGELPEAVARREIMEETNIVPYAMEYICNYLSSPGGTNEKLHLYCGLCDLSRAGGIYGLPEEGEDIRVRILAANNVFVELLSGAFNNAAALICLQWLQHHRPRLRAQNSSNVD